MLIEIFGVIYTILDNIVKDEPNYNVRREAKRAFKAIKCFEFIFILLLMDKVTGVTNFLYLNLNFMIF